MKVKWTRFGRLELRGDGHAFAPPVTSEHDLEDLKGNLTFDEIDLLAETGKVENIPFYDEWWTIEVIE